MAHPTRGRPRSFDRDVALDKAIQLFWRQGYEGTSVRDLTDELGITSPSLYSAFGSKEQLFSEAVDTYDGKYGGFIEAAVQEEPTGRAAAVRILREAPARYTRRGLPAGCLVTRGDAGTAERDVLDRMRVLRESKVAALAARLREDAAAGTPATDVDPEALARYVFAVLGGLEQMARDGRGRSDLRAVAETAVSTSSVLGD